MSKIIRLESSCDLGQSFTFVLPNPGTQQGINTFVTHLALEVTLPVISNPREEKMFAKFVDNIDFRIIDKAVFSIGGVIFDQYDHTWPFIWQQVSSNQPFLENTKPANYIEEKTFYIPLYFYFCRHNLMKLPISLLDEEVTVTLFLNPLHHILEIFHDETFEEINFNHPAYKFGDDKHHIVQSNLLVHYFSETQQQPTETFNFPMEQIRFSQYSIGSSYSKNDIIPEGLCKELFWVCSVDEFAGDHFGHQLFNFTDNKKGGEAVIIMANLCFEKEETILCESNYYNYFLPQIHHTRIPAVGINCYPFCLQPETPSNLHDTGTCDFSKYSKISLNLTVVTSAIQGPKTSRVKIYSLCNNVMEISHGKANMRFPYST